MLDWSRGPKNRMTCRPFSGLYAITPDGLDEDALLSRVDAALRGGVRILQYRDKSNDAERQSRVAHELRKLCSQHGAALIINDNVPLAITVGADGVHLGAEDGDLAAARAALGPERILGASCYASFDLAVAAAKAAADYVAFGAVFPSPTKPLAVRADLSLFARCRKELSIPACAIGGITLANARPVINAGADLLAVITDLFEVPDIETRARDFQTLFFEEQHRDHS